MRPRSNREAQDAWHLMNKWMRQYGTPWYITGAEAAYLSRQETDRVVEGLQRQADNKGGKPIHVYEVALKVHRGMRKAVK